MLHHLEPTGEDPVTFAPREEIIVMEDTSEILINFPVGTIYGADMDEPHPLLMSTRPAGGCIAIPGQEAFSRIALNGEVIAQGEIPFDKPHKGD